MSEFKYRKKHKDFKEKVKTNNDYREIALTKMGKRQLTLTLVSILAVTLISIGSTFAMFTVSSKSAEYNVVKTGTLNIDFSSSSSTIGLDGALPMSDSDGLSQTGNTFTITNTGSLTANYSVSLQDDKDMITQDNCSDKQLDKGFIKYSIDNSAAKLLSGSTDLLISGALKSGETKTFTLKVWIKDDATNEVLGKHYHGKIVVDAIQEKAPVLATKLIMDKANKEDLDYNSSTDEQKKEVWTFSHETTDQTTALTDYRYIGKDPNNYVSFNDELWRIIGVFDVDDGTGKVEKRLKIIRNESIGEYSWDNKNTTTGAEIGDGKNEWVDARINYLLNQGHDSEIIGGSLYWNRQKGDCYSGQSNATVTCDFTSTGLTDKAKNMIGDAKWYLGRNSSYDDTTPQLFYTTERATTSDMNRSVSWIGKVGLVYPSDYGYATSGSTNIDKKVCLTKPMYNWSDADISDCKNNDWLLSENYWTMSTRMSNFDNVFSINYKGINVLNASAYRPSKIRPVVYLKSTIRITSGIGEKNNPYILEE